MPRRRVLFVVFSLLVLGMGWALLRTYARAASFIVDSLDDIRPADVGLVLGASVLPDKRPSPILRDRIRTGVELLAAGKVQRLLMSGEGEQPHYDEVSAMKRTAIELGADEESIATDADGHRTYDSCVNAKTQFHAASVIVVSQRYHLPRAIYLCQGVGLDTQGLAADHSEYQNQWRFALREIPAWILAVIDLRL
jgi:SanA protein